ncbi:MAG TPA: DUF262 domain-containing protein [Bacteroidia bacterium]|nr:DUF262 domain-containing protein [Bacteroidia bacterium]
MSNVAQLSSKIDANDITLAGILDRQKFTIDYFQREYRWERKHIQQLIDDLSSSFLSNYNPEHSRSEVEDYNSYYMGPIVMSNKEGRLSIIDGQQRLTSLTLLLVFLNNRQAELEKKEAVETLIFSEKYDVKSYNMQVEERQNCFDALFNTGEYEPTEDDDESVKYLVARYNDIQEIFPPEINDNALPFFISWLKEKLIFVKIVTYSEENAYTIFETMNDRGLNLTPTEMLKGYLLSKIKDVKKKNELNVSWKKRIGELHEWNQQEDLEFFKTWLRAKYADTIRQGKVGSFNEDFEKIGTTFHTWVKEKVKLIGLEKDTEFLDFVQDKFDFFSRVYLRIIDAQNNYNEDLNLIYMTSWFWIADSLAFPLLMAPIKEDDDLKTQNKKLLLVAHFIDCFAVYRSVNNRTLGQSSLRYTLYTLVKEIRNKDVDSLAGILKKRVQEFEENLDGILEFTLHQQNKRFVRYFLGRITNYIENESGINSHIDAYMSDAVKKPAQIEHIWADIYEDHKDELDQKTDFNWYRNSLGDLVLLPKGTNQSFNKDRYEIKLPHYLKQNLLVQSLHPDCYHKNPNFIKWYKNEGLSFQAHKKFKVQDIETRTELYKDIAEKIWSVDKFQKIAEE